MKWPGHILTEALNLADLLGAGLAPWAGLLLFGFACAGASYYATDGGKAGVTPVARNPLGDGKLWQWVWRFVAPTVGLVMAWILSGVPVTAGDLTAESLGLAVGLLAGGFNSLVISFGGPLVQRLWSIVVPGLKPGGGEP